MKISDFIHGLAEELEIESRLTANTNIKDLDEWDSLQAMVLISYVSEYFGVSLTGSDIHEITTIESLITKIGPERFEQE